MDLNKSVGATASTFYRPRGTNVQDELDKLNQLIHTELNVPVETDIRGNTAQSDFSRESNTFSR